MAREAATAAAQQSRAAGHEQIPDSQELNQSPKLQKHASNPSNTQSERPVFLTRNLTGSETFRPSVTRLRCSSCLDGNSRRELRAAGAYLKII